MYTEIWLENLKGGYEITRRCNIIKTAFCLKGVKVVHIRLVQNRMRRRELNEINLLNIITNVAGHKELRYNEISM